MGSKKCGALIYKMWSTKKFYTENVSIGTYVKGVTETPCRYDVDPPHQRGLVKTEKWNADVIIHLYEFCTLTPIYYHTRKSDGILENLDGKQRTNALVRYMSNRFALPKTCGLPLELCGFFKDLPEAIKSRFYNIQIPLCVTEAELTRDEIKKFFSRVQRSSNTTSGEGMNADLDNNLRNMIYEALDNNVEFNKYCTVSDARFQKLFLVTKCVYVYVHARYNQRLPSIDKIMTWGHSFSDTQKFQEAMTILCKVIKFMSMHNIKQDECQVMALFMLASDIGYFRMILELADVFEDLSKCFDDFKPSGHSTMATLNRYMFLKNKISFT
mgnify:CR=1 FL=1